MADANETGASNEWVALLGVKGGPAIRPGSQMPNATLVRMGGRTILVDAGLGAARGVCDQGVALPDLDAILITHLHSDHYLELGPLLHTAWTAGRAKPITVWGPEGLRHYWQHFLLSMSADIELRIADEGRVPLEDIVTIRTIAPEVRMDLDGLIVEAKRTLHPPLIDCFALRMTSDNAKLVISADTAPFEGWAEWIGPADLLIHEALLSEGVQAVMESLPHHDPLLETHLRRSHTEAADVGRIASRAGVRALAITHFVPEGLPGFGPDVWHDKISRTWNGALILGRDGLRIPLPG